MRVLIVGGYGVFGGRLAGLLADEQRLTLLIAGRSQAKARAFVAGLAAGAGREAAIFDRDGDLADQLAALRPDLIVDASGPFQVYGARPYRLIEAAIAAKVSYMDLADGAAFVDGVGAYDEAARAAGVFVLSGVSSFPVLTAAVVRHLADGLDEVASIESGIAPSPFAGVGENVIRAIAGYAGQPLRLRRAGKDATAYALTESRRYVIRPPGRTPLGSVRFSLVEVPDLRVLPREWPLVRDVWVGAGPTPEVLHRMLNLLSRLVSLGAVRSLLPLAGLFYRVMNTVRWGEHRGGMYVKVDGVRGGAAVVRSWHLLAEGSDGPLIPSMAVEAITRRVLDGRAPQAGARPATRALELADYDALFARRTIYTGTRETGPSTAALPLYRRMLGSAYDTLPPAVSVLHDVSGAARMEGRATVERGRGWMSRLAAVLFGFPPACADVSLTVTFEPIPGGERWRRTFGDASFSSDQTEGQGRWTGLLRERFGPLSFGLALVTEEGRLRLVVRRWSAFGLPMPLSLAAGGPAFEEERDGVFHLHVEIGHPLCGLIVRYRGWLKPSAAKA